MSGKPSSGIVGIVAVAAVLNVCTTPLFAQSIEEKTQVCAGCHGADGKPVDKTIPNIWGQ
jgi:cytochrome c553